ncbi:MAG: hypothetical protein D8M58_17380 [Calditrichaeota bacterium]|nr:MAG: hypothetical protein DWQ03_01295 [Calditrichota bacterium]MBL1207179.1 hypothetical protein [Calditrichota bacterium]NOG47012.1 hypothetical protein [Calditrichota bacterium]
MFKYLLFFFISSLLSAQVAKNLQRAGYIDTETLYRKIDPTRIIDFSAQHPVSDIWGWSYNGVEYGLIGLANTG